MVWQRARKFLNSLSDKASAQRLERRAQQLELDVQRLFWLLSTYAVKHEGSSIYGQTTVDVAARANRDFEAIRKDVDSMLHQQLSEVCTSIHGYLLKNQDPAATEAEALADMYAHQPFNTLHPSSLPPHMAGLVAAPGPPRVPQGAPLLPEDPPQRPALSLGELSRMFREQYGYSLRVDASSIDHPSAGQGLWLDGAARAGRVIAFYPGIVYPPLMHKKIPGYPKVDRDNVYLIARYDNFIVDGKSWHRGITGQHAWPLVYQNNQEALQLQFCEGRHPLALGQYANHPPPKGTPNLMAASFEYELLPGQSGALPRYLPNITYGVLIDHRALPGCPVQGIALVATRNVKDEELFLNYRLTNHITRPDWYEAVDQEEEDRRWA